MAGRSAHAPLDLEEEKAVRIVHSLPASLYLAVYHYCLWRKADASKVQVAATKALQASAEWRAAQPSLSARVRSGVRRKAETEPPAQARA